MSILNKEKPVPVPQLKKLKIKKIQLHSFNEDLILKPCAKSFKTSMLLSKVWFWKPAKKLIIERLSKAFKDWAISCTVKIFNYKD